MFMVGFIQLLMGICHQASADHFAKLRFAPRRGVATIPEGDTQKVILTANSTEALLVIEF